MGTIVGSGDYTYRVDEGWGKLPPGWAFGDVAAVGTDARDNVYVFNRSEHPMVVFDREGNFLRSWGEGVFPRAHGVHMGPDDTIYCTDDGDHTMRKCTLEGKVLLQIGIAGQPAPHMSGAPFHRCTHTACAPNGDFYVADGYVNTRIVKFDKDGKYLDEWSIGAAPADIHLVYMDGSSMLWAFDRNSSKMLKYDLSGHFLYSWGAWGNFPGGFWGTHGMHVDSEGNFYVAEVDNGGAQKFKPRAGANPAMLLTKPAAPAGGTR